MAKKKGFLTDEQRKYIHRGLKEVEPRMKYLKTQKQRMAVAKVLKQIRVELKEKVVEGEQHKRLGAIKVVPREVWEGRIESEEYEGLRQRGFTHKEIIGMGVASAKATYWNKISRKEALKKARTPGARDLKKRKRRLGEPFSAPESDWEETSGGIRRKKEYMDKWRGESRESYLKKPPETEEEETPKHKETPKYVPKEHKEYKEEWEETESGGICRKIKKGLVSRTLPVKQQHTPIYHIVKPKVKMGEEEKKHIKEEKKEEESNAISQ